MNIRDFELYVDETILARGRSYYAAGHVLALEYSNDGEWLADVTGTDDYTITAVLSDKGDILDSTCDCPYDWSEHCKHKTAVFFAIRDKLDTGNVPLAPAKKRSLSSLLQHQSKQTLVSIITNIADSEPHIKEALLARFYINGHALCAPKPRTAFERRQHIENRIKRQAAHANLPAADWQQRMNQAIDYIENNLTGEIDYAVTAQFMRSSVWEFQRLFSFMASLPLSEYVRLRRLSLAAQDIQVGEDRIIDIAVRYNYDSAASFSRAFKQFHGTTPTSVRNGGVSLAVFPRRDFQLAAPNDMISYRLVEKPVFQVIGITKRFTMENGVHGGGIGRLWWHWNNNKMREKHYARYAQGGPHDMCVSLPTDKTDEFYYTVGFLYNGMDNADGLHVVNVPGGTYMVFDIPDAYVSRVGEFMGLCISQYIPAAGYELAGVDAEYFPCGNSVKNEAWFLLKSKEA